MGVGPDINRLVTSSSKYLPQSLKSYSTPKIVKINDPALGILKNTLLLMIFSFIFIFHIMWRGSHLNVAPVRGVVRHQLRDPSEGSCDPFYTNCTFGFSSMSSLPYCKQNNFTGVYQKTCEYWDSVELRQMTDEGMIVPTRVMTFRQRKRCHPSPSNFWSCNGMLFDFIDQSGTKQPENGPPKPVRDNFVADVERFELLLDHSAHSSGLRTTAAYDFEMTGGWQRCTNMNEKNESCTVEPLLCVHKHCPQGSLTPTKGVQDLTESEEISPTLRNLRPYRRRKSYEALEAADEPTLVDEFELADAELSQNEFGVSTHKGDMFQIGKLVKAAGIELDKPVSHGAGGTYRNDGFALVIRIEYTNDEPWVGLKVFPWRPVGPTMRYTYRVMAHSTGDVKFRKVNYWSESDNEEPIREVEEFRGVRVVVEQIGSIKVWDNLQLMFLVTTTLALLAIANCIMDTIALNCMSRSAEFRLLKFEEAGRVPPSFGALANGGASPA